MSQECNGEWNQKENTDCHGLVLENRLQSIKAIACGGTVIDLLEVEKETLVTNAVAVKGSLDVADEVNHTRWDIWSQVFEVWQLICVAAVKVVIETRVSNCEADKTSLIKRLESTIVWLSQGLCSCCILINLEPEVCVCIWRWAGTIPGAHVYWWEISELGLSFCYIRNDSLLTLTHTWDIKGSIAEFCQELNSKT